MSFSEHIVLYLLLLSFSFINSPHIQPTFILFSLSSDPLQALQENTYKGVYSLWLEPYAKAGHEQSEKNF